MKKGILVIVSAPSGGGKNAIIRELIKLFPGSTRFVTTTTRDPRVGEVEGIDYYFVTDERFKQLIDRGEMIEYNFFAGNYYGSEREKLENTLKNHNLTFATLDVNGKKHLQDQGIEHLSIFLLPDNIEVLRERVARRGGLSPEQIDMRMHEAEAEIALAHTYDLPLINPDGNMHEAVAQIQQFLEERLLA